MNVYENHDLAALLAENTYPGRGIVLGKTADGKQSVAAYFIMGRSENSRNRVFVQEPDGIRTEAFDPAKLADPSLIIYHPVRQLGRALIVTNGDQTDTIRDHLELGESFEQGLRTRAFDESKLTDPSLIIYHPVRVTGDTTIVTNGDQTDTIRDALAAGGDFASALRTREFEPDGPNWTPRISGLLSADGSYKMSILKSADAEGSACARYTYEYPGVNGVGHFLHTYVQDGNPIPTFQGEPERVAITGTLDAFAEMIWNNLNEANKISLYVRFTDLATGAYQEKLYNKNK